MAVLKHSPANHVIRRADYGLSPIAPDWIMRLVGMDGREAIGGTLTLTDVALRFTSHGANRVTADLDIPIGDIVDVADTSRFLTRRIEVRTASAAHTFVIWGIPAWLAAIEAARRR